MQFDVVGVMMSFEVFLGLCGVVIVIAILGAVRHYRHSTEDDGTRTYMALGVFLLYSLGGAALLIGVVFVGCLINPPFG